MKCFPCNAISLELCGTLLSTHSPTAQRGEGGAVRHQRGKSRQRRLITGTLFLLMNPKTSSRNKAGCPLPADCHLLEFLCLARNADFILIAAKRRYHHPLNLLNLLNPLNPQRQRRCPIATPPPFESSEPGPRSGPVDRSILRTFHPQPSEPEPRRGSKNTKSLSTSLSHGV